MRPVRWLLVYGAGVFLGGALLAPWLYWLVQGVAAVLPGAASLADPPFHRCVNRSLLLVALAGLWPFLRASGVRSRRDVGLVTPPDGFRRAFVGFGWGFGSFAVAAIVVLAVGERVLNPNMTPIRLVERVFSAATTAAIVAVLEEFLFRGAIYGALRSGLGFARALVISSAIYAGVHFLSKVAAPMPVTWSSGLMLLPKMLKGLIDFQQAVPAFFCLILAGTTLALAYERAGSLHFSIGLHAGWIFWVKTYGVLTQPVATVGSRFWGTNRLIDGWLALIVLGLTLLLSIRLPLRERKPAAADHAPTGGSDDERAENVA